ncbi:hypothetical protein RN001_005225 [Aquatica leii]|uniref:Chemosensory protein n=1 Tax=Aquatica leii TaxID=1421715 RepID=A0AAN7PG20_9COLE|nr:hypothetical protein RN001_005225 [Aquatica leii]
MTYFQAILITAFLLLVKNTVQESTVRPEISDEAINKALNDTRYLTRQIKCTLGEVPCDSVGRRLKSLAPLVLHGSCPQCTPQELRQIQTVLAHVQKKFPKEWNKIIRQYGSG